jgi:hypothetical protein
LQQERRRFPVFLSVGDLAEARGEQAASAQKKSMIRSRFMPTFLRFSFKIQTTLAAISVVKHTQR